VEKKSLGTVNCVTRNFLAVRNSVSVELIVDYVNQTFEVIPSEFLTTSILEHKCG